MATTEHAETMESRSRSKVGVEISEIWNWGWSEHVKVTNTSDQPQDMSGWALGGLNEEKVFHFPLGFTLEPGETVTIHSGANATLKQDPPSDIYWFSEPVWANRGDMAILFDAAGKEVARYIYRMYGDLDLDGEPEKRLVEDEVDGYKFLDVDESE